MSSSDQQAVVTLQATVSLIPEQEGERAQVLGRPGHSQRAKLTDRYSSPFQGEIVLQFGQNFRIY